VSVILIVKGVVSDEVSMLELMKVVSIGVDVSVLLLWSGVDSSVVGSGLEDVVEAMNSNLKAFLTTFLFIFSVSPSISMSL
jgi:hypothetical protein